MKFVLVCLMTAGLVSALSNPWKPLDFEPSDTIERPGAEYTAILTSYALELSKTGIAMRFVDGSALRMNLPQATLEALQMGPVRYKRPFPGVDLVVYGKAGAVEYDWVVAPHADPSAIRFSFSGADSIRLNSEGDLAIETAAGHVWHRRPRIYQDIDGVSRDVAGGFLIAEDGTVGFRISQYDQNRPLIIDPQVVSCRSIRR